ncbi:MAG TPA: hypothetical protein VN755_10670, partial [Steroidobacteraceae bacterium]|nr:hypothetical protein [Steroidobacteraceae bacterium]
MVAVDEVDALGATAGAGGGEEILGLQEKAFEALQAQVQLRAGEPIACVGRDPHMAIGTDAVFDAVVAQRIGADRDAAALQLHIALGNRIQVGPAADLLGPQRHRTFVAGATRAACHRHGF